MASKFRFSVLGEGRVRARGELGFVLPQALDLVAQSSYTAAISEPKGSLHLRRQGDQIVGRWVRNPNVPRRDQPTWIDQAVSISNTLGRSITWQET